MIAKDRKFWGAFLSSAEGQILLTGLVLGLVYVLFMLLAGFWSPMMSHHLVAMTSSHFFFGRAAGMMYGYTQELGHSWVIPVNIIIETLMVLILYPLFILSWQKLLVTPTLQRVMAPLHQAAHNHHETIRKYGIFGLFFFVWLPFWMTGPVVGSIIGFLLGLRHRITLTVVLAGTYVAIFCWALFLKSIHRMAESLHPLAPYILLLVIILFFLLGHYLQSLKKNGRRR